MLRLQTQLRAVVLQCSVFLRGLWLQAHLSPSLCVTLQQLATPPAGQVLQSLSVCRACAVTAVLVQLYPRGWGRRVPFLPRGTPSPYLDVPRDRSHPAVGPLLMLLALWNALPLLGSASRGLKQLSVRHIYHVQFPEEFTFLTT